MSLIIDNTIFHPHPNLFLSYVYLALRIIFSLLFVEAHFLACQSKSTYFLILKAMCVYKNLSKSAKCLFYFLLFN
jgi:hypothetical protein